MDGLTPADRTFPRPRKAAAFFEYEPAFHTFSRRDLKTSAAPVERGADVLEMSGHFLLRYPDPAGNVQSRKRPLRQLFHDSAAHRFMRLRRRPRSFLTAIVPFTHGNSIRQSRRSRQGPKPRSLRPRFSQSILDKNQPSGTIHVRTITIQRVDLPRCLPSLQERNSNHHVD
jgi:hypothetical protein